MKKFLSISDDERQRILEMHNPKTKMMNESAKSMVADAKSKMASGQKPDPKIQEQIKGCITKNQLSSLMVFTTAAGTYGLGLIAFLIASGAATMGIGTLMGGALAAFVGGVTMILSSLPKEEGGMGANPTEDIKILYNCMTTNRPGGKNGIVKESAEQMQGQQMAQDFLDQVKSGEATPDPKIKQSILDCIKKGRYTHLSVLTTGAGATALGALALLLASGVGTLPGLVLMSAGTGIVVIDGLLTGEGSGAGSVAEEIKQLMNCLKAKGQIK